MRPIALLALASLLPACAAMDVRRAESERLARLSHQPPGVELVDPSLPLQVEFDHGCPLDRIRLIRGFQSQTVDVDVCGSTRRYVSQWRGPGAPGSWLDVTSLLPPSALPAPGK